jgi:DNA-directed RNA polymerase specialized sigma24 family protein
MIAKTHKPKHYVDNKTLYETLIKFKNSKKEALALGTKPPRIPEYVGVCIFQIATRLATKGNFINYSYKDEMISDGIENCIQYMDNFDPEKSKNPFAYFTRIIYNAYILRIQKEKKQTYIKYKSFEHSIVSNEFFSISDSDDSFISDAKSHENMHEFVRDYEKKMSEKKLQKEVNLVGLELLNKDTTNV